jgi:Tfp pilus assembly protein PilZ
MRVLRARYRTGEEFLRHYQPAFLTGGLFFPTREVLPVGEQVVVEVRFPQLCNKTMIRGQVAWCRGGKHRAKIRAGLGIEFQPTESHRRDFLLAAAKGQGRAVVVRRHRRLPVMLSAGWRRTHEREVHKSQVEDIGPGGAFLRASERLPLGTDIVIDVVPPGSVRAIEIACRVAWARQVPGEDGFGVEFRCRDAGGARRLKELVRRLEEMEEQSALSSEPGDDGAEELAGDGLDWPG